MAKITLNSSSLSLSEIRENARKLEERNAVFTKLKSTGLKNTNPQRRKFIEEHSE